MNDNFTFKNEEAKQSWIHNTADLSDLYYKCIIDYARRAMEILETTETVDAWKIIGDVENELKYGITGYQTGCIAQIVFITHKKGDDFKRSWNKKFNKDENLDYAYNPAII